MHNKMSLSVIATFLRRGLIVVTTSAILAGCSGASVEDYADTSPRLDIAEYFKGKTRAWGMVQDYSGEVQKRFTVNIDGSVQGNTLTLDERFTYDDGTQGRRVWIFKRRGDHYWQGRANDVEGTVDAQQYGHVFHMSYPLDVTVGGRTLGFTMNDWMYLQPDGKLINLTSMSKFGITLGRITITFDKISSTLADDYSNLVIPGKLPSRVRHQESWLL